MVGQTIVANASEHYIWVLMDADRKYTTEKNEKLATRLEESNAKERAAKVAASGGFKTIWNASVEVDGSSKDQNSRSDFSEDAKDLKQEMHHIAYSTGFSRILPGKYLKFKTEGEPHVSLVWITIHVEKIDGTIEPICNAYSISCNQSLIVGADLQIYLQNYGSGHFIDENGKDHKMDLLLLASMKASESKICALKGNNGKYVSGENGHGPVWCSRQNFEDSEIFIWQQRGNKYTIQSMGKYLSSENGEKPMTCHRTSANDWELFEMIWSNDNDERTLSLKGNNGKFVSIGNGNEPMWCKSGEIGDTEKFHYHPLYKFSNEIIG